MIGVIRVQIARTRSVPLDAPCGKIGLRRYGMRYANHSETQEKKGMQGMADKRYIDAGRLSREVIESWDKDKHVTIEASRVHRQEHVHLMRIIEKQPAADVVEVRHGEWKQATEPCGWHDVDCVVCSACGESWILDGDFDFDVVKDFWNYCHNCGAKMDGERKEQS